MVKSNHPLHCFFDTGNLLKPRRTAPCRSVGDCFLVISNRVIATGETTTIKEKELKKPKTQKRKNEIIYTPYYEGLRINTGTFKQLGVYKSMLRPMLDQINALLTYHSRVSLLVFELHLPVTNIIPAASGNQMVSKFFKQIKEDFASSTFGNQKHVIHCWAREVGTSKNGHYHCMVGVSSTVRIGTLYTQPSTGAWELLERRWNDLSDGSLSESGCHVVNRSNHKELDNAFYHLSYMCKVRDKQFGTGENHKRFSSSRLKPKEVTDQILTAGCHPESLEYFFAA